MVSFAYFTSVAKRVRACTGSLDDASVALIVRSSTTASTTIPSVIGTFMRLQSTLATST